ncbi:hypothetical protein ASD00_36315 [Ensifer sp. Root31]|nr:hypothetical protein ASD00_36315 [Ensifer sp. Root31]
MDAVPFNEIATEQNFNELAYLACIPDVKAAVDAGHIPSGKHHFKNFGSYENRRQLALKDLRNIRAAKLEKGKGCLRVDMVSTIDEGAVPIDLKNAVEAAQVTGHAAPTSAVFKSIGDHWWP